MDFLKLVKDQRSIRKYTSEQISREEMDMILEAGACAPNAGGSQRNMFVGIRDAQLTHRIGRMNYRPFHRGEVNVSHVSREQPSLIDDGSIKDGFYGAPAVIAIFGEKDFPFSIADAFCAAEICSSWRQISACLPASFPGEKKPFLPQKDRICSPGGKCRLTISAGSLLFWGTLPEHCRIANR